MSVCRSNRHSRPLAALAAAVLLGLSWAMPAACADDPPKTQSDCESLASRQADAEFMSQRTATRENSPFARSPSGAPDPMQQNANQQSSIDRVTRQQQLYKDCVAKLPK